MVDAPICAVRKCPLEAVTAVDLGGPFGVFEFAVCANHGVELIAGEVYSINEDRTISIRGDAVPVVLTWTMHKSGRSRYPMLTLGLGVTADVEQEVRMQFPLSVRRHLHQWLSTRLDED